MIISKVQLQDTIVEISVLSAAQPQTKLAEAGTTKHLKYAVKNDVGVVTFDSPGRVSIYSIILSKNI